MSDQKHRDAAVSLGELDRLLKAATPGPWIENGTLIGPTLYETDASTSEGEPGAWITFKTPRPQNDRALFIALVNAAPALLRVARAAHELNMALYMRETPEFIESSRKRLLAALSEVPL